jgi:cytochrome c biogenesis protein
MSIKSESTTTSSTTSVSTTDINETGLSAEMLESSNEQSNKNESATLPASSARVEVKKQLSPFASVKLSVILMSLMALTIMIGAGCPQESQVGQEKVFEAFDRQTAEMLVRLGISDIYHSPWFLALTATLTLNMIVVSFQRVFPKLKQLKNQLPFIKGSDITRLSVNRTLDFAPRENLHLQQAALLAELSGRFTKMGYKVQVDGLRLKGEYGKIGRLAPSVTHVGLLSLLLGITITSWTGFNGFQPVLLDEKMTFADSQHSKLWIGTLPAWKVRVDGTRRENYTTGEAKQWFSNLSVVNDDGKVLHQGEISVNNPLGFEGVDIYQSSWGLAKLVVSFNGHKRTLDLRPMGNKYACFLPLDPETVLIMSLTSEGNSLRLFAKRKEWEAPKLISEIGLGKSVKLGDVNLVFEKVIAVTGLQYKRDPGLPVTYVAFAIIMLGVMLAAVPHRHVWVAIEGGKLFIGGNSRKAKVGFERSIDNLIEKIKGDFALEPEKAGDSDHV